MTERPIIFSAPMVRAILAGSKTQTRRVAKVLIRDDLTLPRCPYGAPGDTLWVRETTRQWVDGALPMTEYVADGWAPRLRWAYSRPTRPSIHMPRAAARILLRVTGVRVERLQEISEDDARAEGWDLATKQPPVEWYRALWDDINAARGFRWLENPWVWVISFDLERP